MVIVVVLQFMLLCAPLYSQAAALSPGNKHGQFHSINRELVQGNIKLRSASVEKDNRQSSRGYVNSNLQQSWLLQELLISEVDYYGSHQLPEKKVNMHKSYINSKGVETGLLDELLVKTSLP